MTNNVTKIAQNVSILSLSTPSLRIYLSYCLQNVSDWLLGFAIPTFCILRIYNPFFCSNNHYPLVLVCDPCQLHFFTNCSPLSFSSVLAQITNPSQRGRSKYISQSINFNTMTYIYFRLIYENNSAKFTKPTPMYIFSSTINITCSTTYIINTTIHIASSTINIRCSTINVSSSTINITGSTTYIINTTINIEPSTINIKCSTIYNTSSTINNTSSTINNTPYTIYKITTPTFNLNSVIY